MKIRLVGSKLFHADEQIDGQTDMTKLMSLLPRLPREIKEFYS